MSYRQLKLKLYAENPYCHYCKKKMVITNITKGRLPKNAATIEHLISRINFRRWVKKQPGQKRKVLACHGCNQARSIKETLCLSREEILKRSNGFSLSPKGKPKIVQPLITEQEVISKLDIPQKDLYP